MAEDHAWLGEILNEAGLRKWCRDPMCTTCGSIMFRAAYLARAARVAGIKPTFGPDSLDALQAEEPSELSKIFDYLTAVSPEGREKIFDALVAGVRQLSPGWQGSDGLSLILTDLERLNLQGGMLKQLSAQLEGTPGGDERHAMQEHEYRLSQQEGWNETPSPKLLREDEQKLIYRIDDCWDSIAGPELSAITIPIRLTGRKKRRLVCNGDPKSTPPWGNWDTQIFSHTAPLPRDGHRIFTEFRRRLNKVVQPHEIDHVDFICKVTLTPSGQ